MHVDAAGRRRVDRAQLERVVIIIIDGHGAAAEVVEEPRVEKLVRRVVGRGRAGQSVEARPWRRDEGGRREYCRSDGGEPAHLGSSLLCAGAGARLKLGLSEMIDGSMENLWESTFLVTVRHVLCTDGQIKL